MLHKANCSSAEGVLGGLHSRSNAPVLRGSHTTYIYLLTLPDPSTLCITDGLIVPAVITPQLLTTPLRHCGASEKPAITITIRSLIVPILVCALLSTAFSSPLNPQPNLIIPRNEIPANMTGVNIYNETSYSGKVWSLTLTDGECRPLAGIMPDAKSMKPIPPSVSSPPGVYCEVYPIANCLAYRTLMGHAPFNGTTVQGGVKSFWGMVAGAVECHLMKKA
ncbi:hypothetical protein BDV95DRAFT_156689 [Massariosphaeria phaeospora]|uniref:Uncharacterized protein n=1 Tax=Massariosphaeria phaeospora TaxID=100035 RepID=A0A7C8I8U5_9PLEO|nr:hypothetical protein BDV95DRAFT_156689 [Massariosphaeria phaeospora]